MTPRDGSLRSPPPQLPFSSGLIPNVQDYPVAVDVDDGNVTDHTTLPPQVRKLRQRYGLRNVVIVGDRGMIAE